MSSSRRDVGCRVVLCECWRALSIIVLSIIVKSCRGGGRRVGTAGEEEVRYRALRGDAV